ncbi:hypothetical protein [Mesorhizobium sp. WSM2239]|uniref:Gene transfer agent family protein n=2 Tax=unclassified Mesorhizobium TaxID=325217 RepID=A0AAU8D757_9HYPH
MNPNPTSLTEIAAGARSAMFLGTEIAWRLTDVLVAKGILTKGEARSTLYAIAGGIRDDADGTTSTESTEVLARHLEEAGDRYKA